MLIFQLRHLPDLGIQTYTGRYGGEVRGKVLERQQAFLHLIHDLGMHNAADSDAGNGTAVSLRFVYDPARTDTETQSIFLLVHHQSGMSDDKVAATLLRSPLAEFYPAWDPLVDPSERERARGGLGYRACVHILKEEAAPPAQFKLRERQDLALAELREQSGRPGPTLADVREDYQGLSDSPFYFVPLYVPYMFEAAEDQDMLFLDRYFDAYQEPFMVEVTLQPTRPQARELLAVEKMLNHLERVKSYSVGPDDGRLRLRGEHQDLTAEAISEVFEEYHATLLTERQFEFAIKVWGRDVDLTSMLASAIAQSCDRSGKYRKRVAVEGSPDFSAAAAATRAVTLADGAAWEEFWDSSWEEAFREDSVFPFNRTGRGAGDRPKRESFSFIYDLHRFARLTRLENIGAFFRLPIPGPEPLKTLRKETQSRVGGEGAGLVLGNDGFKPRLQHRLDLKQLTKHMFVSGVPGSGKTTAILNQLVQLHECGIPFLVFEPAKTEYRVLKRLRDLGADGPRNPAGELLGDVLQVYTLGQETLSPLRMNPFEFPRGITLNEHLSALEACFKGALPIAMGPLPALINEAVDEIYARAGWSGTRVNAGDREYPTLDALYSEIQAVFERKNYSGDVRGDLQTAIEVRLGTLLRRSVGRIFDTARSLPDIETLMTRPCVLELDALNEEHTNLMIMFLLAQVREYVRANRRSGAGLSHVIVLEEAHNIVGKADESGEEGGNPKVEATKYVTRFLAEVRALGEGIIIADQLPSAVAPEVIKNTNVKLAHRMVAGDDREELGLTMLLDPGQFEEMARLRPGEAFLYQEGMYKPVKLKGRYVAERYPVLSQAPPDSAELLALIRDQDWYQKVRAAVEAQALEDVLDV